MADARRRAAAAAFARARPGDALKPVHTLSDEELARLAQRAAALPDAPPALVRQAIDLWPAPGRAAAPAPAAQGAWRRIVATLAFDSWAAPAVAWAVRAAASEQRHLLFSAGGCDVDLRIAATGDRFSVTGQLLGPDASGSLDVVSEPDDGPGATHAVPLDALGEFRLDGLRAGTCRITVRTGGDEIVLPPFVVEPWPR